MKAEAKLAKAGMKHKVIGVHPLDNAEEIKKKLDSWREEEYTDPAGGKIVKDIYTVDVPFEKNVEYTAEDFIGTAEPEERDYDEYRIRKVQNGLILDFIPSGEYAEPSTIVGVDEDLFQCEVENFAAFLQSIDEHYGPSTGKYSPKRIYVRIEPGHGTEGMTEDEIFLSERLIDMKEDLSWEEYGKKVHQELKEDIDNHQEFVKQNL